MFRKLLGVALIFVLSPALADGLSYNYVELGYQRADIDGISEEPDGFGINGSFEVGENWFIVAGYGQVEESAAGIDAELDSLAVGFGYHTPISDNVDFFGSLSWLRSEVSLTGFGSIDEDGYGIEVGMRGAVSDSIELSASIGYADLGDWGDGTAYSLGFLYKFTENFGLGLNVNGDDDVTIYGVGARFYFGS